MNFPPANNDSQTTTHGTPLVEGPAEVRVVRVLGHGRAATAQLVDATLSEGRTVRCVEKVFCPGLLTRFIYRCSFQSPFAYQSNRHAILASFYRRRVAASILAASDLDADVAIPLYVRFDREQQAWVLAAEWVDGRGIRPTKADRQRIRRRWGWGKRASEPTDQAEIAELVTLMRRLEREFAQSGLVGSGWQVAPRALVSTANLLRVGDRYTVIDLESGIPAVLVPQYIWAGARQGSLPPFDDLDASRLQRWFEQQKALLTFRLGPQETATLGRDIEQLIQSSLAWKDSELALFRRPWRWLRRDQRDCYRQETVRRWQQEERLDSQTAQSIHGRSLRFWLIWLAGLLPSILGRTGTRLLGNRDFRRHVGQLLSDRAYLAKWWNRRRRRLIERLGREDRIDPTTRPLQSRWLPVHAVLRRLTPAGLHRYLCDPVRRSETRKRLLLLTFSPRYQRWFGQRQVETAIDRWYAADRLSDSERDNLYESLSGDEVRAYTRGFGMHLALKALAPLIAPAKVGGIAGFIASGQIWFLLPLLLTPLLRTSVTLISAWNTRHRQIAHGEALLMGLLPTVGSLAFPLQMFSSRGDLSIFLIRDAASRLGQKIPVYGGADSRTEIALIQWADCIVELLDVLSGATKRLSRPRMDAAGVRIAFASRADQSNHPQGRTRLGHWIDRQAILAIESQSHSRRPAFTMDVPISEAADDRRAA